MRCSSHGQPCFNNASQDSAHTCGSHAAGQTVSGPRSARIRCQAGEGRTKNCGDPGCYPEDTS